jgi:hypothetical protein
MMFYVLIIAQLEQILLVYRKKLSKPRDANKQLSLMKSIYMYNVLKVSEFEYQALMHRRIWSNFIVPPYLLTCIYYTKTLRNLYFCASDALLMINPLILL